MNGTQRRRRAVAIAGYYRSINQDQTAPLTPHRTVADSRRNSHAQVGGAPGRHAGVHGRKSGQLDAIKFTAEAALHRNTWRQKTNDS